MTAKMSILPVPDMKRDVLRARRVIDQNFQSLRDQLNRAIRDNGLIIVSSVDHGGLDATSLLDDDHTQYHNDARALTWLGTRSTTDLPEGTNLYYTDARFDTRFATKTTGDLAEGVNLYFTDARVAAYLASLGSAIGDILYYNGTAWVSLAAGAVAEVLTGNGAGAAPSWQSPSGGGGSPPDDFDLLTNGIDELIFDGDGDVIWIV